MIDRVQLDIQMGLQAAGTSRSVRKKFELPGSWFIEAVSFLPDDSVTANDTNYTTVALANTTDSVTLHSRATTVAGGSLTAGTAVDATLTEGAARVISENDLLTFSKTDSGSGQALGGTYSLVLVQRALP